VPNFFDAPPRPRPNGGAPESYFLFVGRLDERKGLPVLLDAFEQYGGPARLRVIGTGPLDDRVRALAPRVELLGPRSADEILDEMAGAAGFVLPSASEENCPMTVLEARSQRAPVICSDHGGAPELVSDGVDGLLFPPGDSRALADGLRALTDQPSLGAELADRGLERLRTQHSKARYYDGLMEAYAVSSANRGHDGSTSVNARSRAMSGR
jgi:glycosyltransferase involved in cell wall biosynthesis